MTTKKSAGKKAVRKTAKKAQASKAKQTPRPEEKPEAPAEEKPEKREKSLAPEAPAEEKPEAPAKEKPAEEKPEAPAKEPIEATSSIEVPRLDLGSPGTAERPETIVLLEGSTYTVGGHTFRRGVPLTTNDRRLLDMARRNGRFRVDQDGG